MGGPGRLGCQFASELTDLHMISQYRKASLIFISFFIGYPMLDHLMISEDSRDDVALTSREQRPSFGNHYPTL
jgi:hypothetical protein